MHYVCVLWLCEVQVADLQSRERTSCKTSRSEVERECVLFIGTQFSNLYAAVDAPSKAAWLCV